MVWVVETLFSAVLEPLCELDEVVTRFSTSEANFCSSSVNLTFPLGVLDISCSILCRHASVCGGLDMYPISAALHPLHPGVYPMLAAAALTLALVR